MAKCIVNSISTYMQPKQRGKFFTDKCDIRVIFQSIGPLLLKKMLEYRAVSSVFHCFTTEKPSIPLLCGELYYVLIIQNYQPALNSSRLHCLRLMWLI